MIKRDLYLNQLCNFIDKPLIKVITGIRRCGKSAMLLLLKEELLGRGVSPENIVLSPAFVRTCHLPCRKIC